MYYKILFIYIVFSKANKALNIFINILKNTKNSVISINSLRLKKDIILKLIELNDRINYYKFCKNRDKF